MNQFKDRYCFIHLPKSAGTSVLQFLRGTLGENEVLYMHGRGAHAHASLEYLITRYRALVGHFEVSNISQWMFENVFLFTFLRDPVDRVLSNYYYYRNVQHERLVFEMKRAQQMDLLSLLRECDLSRPSVWSNWQTFALSGAEHSAFVPGTILEPAKRTLDRLDFVGFFESLREDVRRLSEMCGWNREVPLPMANVTPQRSSRARVDPETLELIQQLNRDDIELYQYAKALPPKPAPRPGVPSPSSSAANYRPPAFLCTERGSREVFIAALSARGAASNSDLIPHDDQVEIRLEGESTIHCPDLVAGIRITDSLGLKVYGTNSLLLGKPIVVRPGEKFTVLFSFPAILGAGNYYLTAAFHAEDGRNFHWIDNGCLFVVLAQHERIFEGMVDLKAQLNVSLQTERDDLTNPGLPNVTREISPGSESPRDQARL
ncbi:MAG TPA: Wzt carbohydrate-binding domain-containing protein [Chthoniobacterales bacterium]|nr:Wzt carbohydrate-binding domain-containing protein [Chthoniobacterales bacterium]